MTARSSAGCVLAGRPSGAGGAAGGCVWWAGLFAWHWQHRSRFTPALRARFTVEAAGLLDTADPDELAAVIKAMPESRRQAVESLRRAARVLSLAPLPRGPR